MLQNCWTAENPDRITFLPILICPANVLLLEKIQFAVDNSAPRVKLKVRKGWDLEVLKAVKSTFPSTLFHIDCNSGYTLDDIDFFKAIDDLGLAFIEQPLSNDDIFLDT